MATDNNYDGLVFDTSWYNSEGDFIFAELKTPTLDSPVPTGEVLQHEQVAAAPVASTTVSPLTTNSLTTNFLFGEDPTPPPVAHNPYAPQPDSNIVTQYANTHSRPPPPPQIALPTLPPSQQIPLPTLPHQGQTQVTAVGQPAYPEPFQQVDYTSNYSNFDVLEPLPASGPHDMFPPPLETFSAPVSRPPSTRYPSPVPHAATAAPSRQGTPNLSRPFTLPPDSPGLNGLIPKKTKGEEINYSKFYERLPATPAPYLDKFFYNRNGEWLGNLNFDAKEISFYIKSRRAQKLPLRIWIQNMPAGCIDRGGLDPRTRKCRWKSCPAKHNTILKGFWRVAFDERPETSGKTTDPYMNAGYFHLYCFEQCFDLIGLIGSHLDVRPENRALPSEVRNPMAIARDHPAMLDTYNQWKYHEFNLWSQWVEEDTQRRKSGMPSMRRNRQRENYLWYQLTLRHLGLETSARQTVRNQRDGVSIDKHLGDLELFVRLINKRTARAREARGKLRKLAENPCEDEDEDKLQERDDRLRQAGRRPLPRGQKRRRQDDYGDDDQEQEVDYDSQPNESPYGSILSPRRSRRIAEIQSRDSSPTTAHPAKRQRLEAPQAPVDAITVKMEVWDKNRQNLRKTARGDGLMRNSGCRSSFP